MLNPDQLVCIGYTARPHGFDGKIRIVLSDNFRFRKKLSTREPVFFKIEGYMVPFFFDKLSVAEDQLIIHPEGWKAEKDAQTFSGLEVFVDQKLVKTVEKEGDFLAGFTLFNASQERIGLILEVLHDTAQPLLVVEVAGEEKLIPFVEELVLTVDPKKKEIALTLPEGILDL